MITYSIQVEEGRTTNPPPRHVPVTGPARARQGSRTYRLAPESGWGPYQNKPKPGAAALAAAERLPQVHSSERWEHRVAEIP